MNSTRLATLRDYVERSRHWIEGGATRHDALLALNALEQPSPPPLPYSVLAFKPHGTARRWHYDSYVIAANSFEEARALAEPYFKPLVYTEVYLISEDAAWRAGGQIRECLRGSDVDSPNEETHRNWVNALTNDYWLDGELVKATWVRIK
jgi:hypothetical protein